MRNYVRQSGTISACAWTRRKKHDWSMVTRCYRRGEAVERKSKQRDDMQIEYEREKHFHGKNFLVYTNITFHKLFPTSLSLSHSHAAKFCLNFIYFNFSTLSLWRKKVYYRECSIQITFEVDMLRSDSGNHWCFMFEFFFLLFIINNFSKLNIFRLYILISAIVIETCVVWVWENVGVCVCIHRKWRGRAMNWQPNERKHRRTNKKME